MRYCFELSGDVSLKWTQIFNAEYLELIGLAKRIDLTESWNSQAEATRPGTSWI